MEDVKKAYAWQSAIQLSQTLVQLIEEFSDASTNVLAHHVRQAVVDIPATVAADLKSGGKPNREPAIKLAAELELIQKIYPAIDTGEAEEQLDGLLARMDAKFDEREPEPEVEAEEADEQPESEEAETAPAPANTVIDVTAPKES